MQKTVVFDSGIDELNSNKLFSIQETKNISHTLSPLAHLFDVAKMNNIELITPDLYLKQTKKPKKVLLISHLFTKHTKTLLTNGIKPILLTCQESPFIATKFYLKLQKFSSYFKYSMVFSGMKKHISKKSNYLQMFFPQSIPENFNKTETVFSNKKFLIMISRNKKVSDWKKNIFLKTYYGIGIKEIYKERLKIINYFSKTDLFDLYGFDWDKMNYSHAENNFIKLVYKGKIDNKFDTLKNYKFSFCFENSIFPGYITEKIFDAFFAKSIPIYLGAPDIVNYIPPETFIDYRNFNNINDLKDYVMNINEKTYNEYLKNINNFINSEKFKIFSEQTFIKKIIDIINSEYE